LGGSPKRIPAPWAGAIRIPTPRLEGRFCRLSRAEPADQVRGHDPRQLRGNIFKERGNWTYEGGGFRVGGWAVTEHQPQTNGLSSMPSILRRAIYYAVMAGDSHD